MKRILSLIGALLLCLTGCAQPQVQIPELLEPATAQPQIVAVEYSDIFNLVAVEGAVIAYYEPVSFAVNGVIEQVFVTPGQSVAKGQKLAVLNTESLQDQLDALTKSREEMQTTYALNAANLELTIQIRNLELEALAQSQKEAYSQQEELLLQAQTSMDEMVAEQSAAELVLEEQIAQIRQELDNLATLPEGTEPSDPADDSEPAADELREELERQLAALTEQLEQLRLEHVQLRTAAQKEIDTLTEQLDKLATANSLRYQAKELEITAAKNARDHARENHEFQLESIELSVSQIRDEIEKAVVVAPFDGEVTWASDLLIKGTWVTSDDVLFCVSDPTRLTVQTERISSNRLDICDRIVAVDGDQEYALTAVAPSVSEDVSRTLSGQPLISVFRFADENNVPEQRNVMVLCRYLYCENVLNIPSGALMKDQSGTFVYVLADGQRQRVNVTVGRTTTLWVEILSGLKEGDVVYAAN